MFKSYRVHSCAFGLGLLVAFLSALVGGALVEAACFSTTQSACGPDWMCADECEETAAACRLYKQTVEKTNYSYCIPGSAYGACTDSPSTTTCFTWFRCTRSDVVCGEEPYYYCQANPAVGGTQDTITIPVTSGTCAAP